MSDNSTIKARGERIAKLRKETKLTRVEFCKKYNIPETTMKTWEYGVSGNITAESLSQLMKAFKDEGVFCTADYLLNGETLNIPHYLLTDDKNQLSTQQDKYEIEIFYKINKNAMHVYVRDNTMAPCLRIGDLVLGLKWDIEDRKTILNTMCIVEGIDGTCLVRNVLPTNKRDLFLLNTLQKDEQGIFLINKHEISSIAPVVKILCLMKI